jgi:hypothetical protein
MSSTLARAQLADGDWQVAAPRRAKAKAHAAAAAAAPTTPTMTGVDLTVEE